jgi:predicted nuclease of predicted toxin-antitoxin system
MKIKLDENMPVTLVHRLKSAGQSASRAKDNHLRVNQEFNAL